jgi:hypothetical protein
MTRKATKSNGWHVNGAQTERNFRTWAIRPGGSTNREISALEMREISSPGSF